MHPWKCLGNVSQSLIKPELSGDLCGQEIISLRTGSGTYLPGKTLTNVCLSELELQQFLRKQNKATEVRKYVFLKIFKNYISMTSFGRI